MLLANATSKLQPMDQGIINNVKTLYRNKMLSKLICLLDRGADSTVTLLDALHYINVQHGMKFPKPQYENVSKSVG